MGVLRAGDEAQGAACKRNGYIANRLMGIVDIMVERHLRAWANAQRGLILKQQLRDAVGACPNSIVLENASPDGERVGGL